MDDGGGPARGFDACDGWFAVCNNLWPAVVSDWVEAWGISALDFSVHFLSQASKAGEPLT